MTTTSAQTSYANQPGYNDCLPSVFASSSRSSLNLKGLRPTTIASPFPGATISAPPTAAGVSPAAGASVATSKDPATSGEPAQEAEKSLATPEATANLLNAILGFESTLPDREFNHYKARLQAAVPALPSQHLEVVHSCFENVLAKPSPEAQSAAKQEIIDHMMAHNGVSAWALPLRKVVESMVV